MPARNTLTFLFSLAMAAMLGSCSRDEQVGPVIVSVIGTDKQLAEPLKSVMSPASKLILEATAQGVVAFDESGQIVPALAQRWIVEDEGRSYIFRLRRARWPDGSHITAPEVARLLEARIKANLALDPLGDLEVVREVVPMTGEVIEIRLSAARPYFLQMLAQPQMAITGPDGGTGPYRKQKRAHTYFLRPVDDPMAHAGEDMPEIPAWHNRVVRAERAAKAISRFKLGLSQLVLGGRLADLPLLSKSGVDNSSVHIDPVQGLLGLAVTGRSAFLDDDPIREAISAAIERERLLANFAIGGWGITDMLMPQQLDLPRPPTAPRWHGLSINERRNFAANAVNQWRSANGAVPVLRIALPEGAGARILFQLISSDLRRIGVPSRQVPIDDDEADLRLIDEVAAYDSAAWYLGRLSCARKVHCSEAADVKLSEAAIAPTEDARFALLADAEALVVAHAGYIPLAAPVRWSLATRLLNGFTSSPRARHPLNHLFRATN
ncbi:ABC transporter substrate-binding protein [Sphingobium phenoxybenzoativorans]|uniref:ABC transporter substrate-binding protein n=1 Tax=Sphingobium phenoxybenzoativorans TaxID=1592790 RepID=UPI0008733612|nr:ABC transporter substrate-binding protein [Sphingobium phenoxybenzoativorans]